jgi:hypothetical protein
VAFAAAVGIDDRTVDLTARAAPLDVSESDDGASAPSAARSTLGDDALVLRLADELRDTGTVTDPTWAGLRARFGEPELLEMIVVVGFYHLISFVANGARVELEAWAAQFPSGAIPGIRERSPAPPPPPASASIS